MFTRIFVNRAAAAAVGLAAVFAGSCGPASPAPDEDTALAAAKPSRPNVIWILADTLRAENLSSYGYERPTSPTIDALGARGVVFENHFSQGLWTMISVPTIMTGQYFPVNVVENFDYRVINRSLPPQQQTAPEVFKENGYKTTMFTAHRLLVSESSRLGRAFDEAHAVLNASGQKPYATFADVNDAFFAWLSEQDDAPFFAYLHLMDNHFPHMPTGKYGQWLRDDVTPDVFGSGGPVDTNQHFAQADMAQMAGLYDGDVLFVDDQLARLQNYLERRGLLANTLIMLTSDHGDLLGEDGTSWGHDGFSQDQIMHVPWIMAGPGIPEGVRVSAMTENVDVLPTIVDVLGLNAHGTFDGRSAADNLTGPPTRARKYVFARNPNKRHYDYPTSFILRTDAVKYEFDPVTGEEHLWQVPDNAGDRKDVLDANRAVAADLRGILEKDYIPLFDTFMHIEIDWILGRVGGGESQNWTPLEAVRVLERHQTADDLATDNLWTSTPTMAGPNFLTSCGWLENAPPVTLHYPVPDGRYFVAVELGRHTLLNDRASSMSIRAEDDTADAPIRFVTGDEPWSYQYGGTWEIKDGSFDIEFEEGQEEDWATLRRLRMHPAINAVYSFPIASVFDRRRGGGSMTIAPDDAYVVRDRGAEEFAGDAANRWQVVQSAVAPFAALTPPIETVNDLPVNLIVDVPNGRYGIDLEVESGSESAELRYRTQGDAEFRTFQSGDGESERQFLRGGPSVVENGRFELTLLAGGAGEVLKILGLHLVPVSEDGQPLDPAMLPHRGIYPPDPESADTADDVNREELEAIGYIH